MVTHLQSGVINGVIKAVVFTPLDHPALLTALSRGVQTRLRGGQSASNVTVDLNLLNTMGRTDDQSLPLLVYLEAGLFALELGEMVNSEGGQAFKAAREQLIESLATQDGPEFTWKASDVDLERITAGVSSLLDIAWLEVGLVRSRAVVRVDAAGGFGTAFLVAPNVLLTNHHVVFPDGAGPDVDVVAWFHYQDAPPGGAAVVKQEVKGIARAVESDETDDWALIRLEQEMEIQALLLRSPKRPARVGDRVCIIQHPDGGMKKISVHKNLVRSASQGRVQYLTDTMPGSSGSPVFDDTWTLIALHHASISRRGGKFIEYRNEGIAIDAVVRGIQARCETEMKARLGL